MEETEKEGQPKLRNNETPKGPTRAFWIKKTENEAIWRLQMAMRLKKEQNRANLCEGPERDAICCLLCGDMSLLLGNMSPILGDMSPDLPDFIRNTHFALVWCRDFYGKEIRLWLGVYRGGVEHIIETEIEINAGVEKYYNIWKQAHHIPNIAGDHIEGVDCHEGDWRTHGDGTSGVFKEKVEFDDENKAVILNGFEGDVFNEYKLFKPVYHVVPNPKGRGSIAKLSIEYEKLNEGVPPPDKYVKLMVNISKDLDVHFGKA
ncbi:MLP-like protein 328 [Morus notabilis]|uniref:MLP-like protein 328 n=1 Tax=Morus notabilis TaxID=981085 RepID=W9S5R1_9ROSA|nr:MLP-like protein 328 [Morus notabilis]